MPVLPRKVLFALEAVLDIAYNSRAGPVQAREITTRQGIPPRYLEPVMQQLVRAGILKGLRGPHGGYVLARERRRITLGEILRIVEESEARGSPPETLGSELGRRVVQPLWQQLGREMMERLDAITVEELCRKAQMEGIESVAERPSDFTI
jgi:Rrf2 family protein